MANAMDLLGSLIQQGLKGPNSGRVEHSLGDQGIGGRGGFLDEILGGLSGQQPKAAEQESGGLPGALGSVSDLAGSILGDSKSLKAGGLGALAGAILGGGGRSMAGAMGGGALALLGSLALKALRRRWRKVGGKADARLRDQPERWPPRTAKQGRRRTGAVDRQPDRTGND